MEENKNYVSVDDLIKQAEEQFKQFIKEGKYKDILLSMSNLNCYSITNQMLILAQMPQARCVNGMKVWNYNKRNIIKGQKAIKIISPLIEKRKEEILDNDGNAIETEEVEIVGYKVAYVFDISQTEGRELYEFKCDEKTAIENFELIKDFFLGRYDFNAPTNLVKEYYDLLDAPDKKIVWFEHSGHSPWINESEKFIEEVLTCFIEN